MPRISVPALCMAAFHMKARPYRLEVVPLKTAEVKHAARALGVSIVLVALLFSGWLFDDPLATFSDGACSSPEGQMERYVEDMKNFTGYYEAVRLFELANHTEVLLFNVAQRQSYRWNCENYDQLCVWPASFQPACQLQTHVEPRRCIKDFGGFLNFFGVDDVCVEERVFTFDPCAGRTPDHARPPPRIGRDASANVPPAVRNAVSDAILTTVARAKVASSVYCLWVAAMIFVGPAYHLYAYSVKGRLQSLLLVNKLLFITVVLSVWYIAEQVNSFIIDNPRAVKLGLLAERDPCFIDSDFLTDLSSEFSQLCEDIEDNRIKFHHMGRLIEFYAQVEDTWTRAGRNLDGNVYSYTPENFTAGCDTADDVLDSLSVPETGSNGLFYLVNSGFIGAIFLQALLVNFIWYMVEFYKPLAAYNGRVVADPHYSVTESDPNRFDGFIRAQHLLGFTFNFAFLILVLVNLGFPEVLEVGGDTV